MPRPKQPTSVGGIEFDALIEYDATYEADVPEYPTEKGFSVSDNIALKPETLNLTLFVSDTPVTWRARHGSYFGRSEEVEKRLKDMYFKREPVEVVMPDKVYSKMAITSMSIRNSSEIGYAKEVQMALKEIVVTETATVSIPDSIGKSGTSEAKAGTANVTGASTGTGTSGSSTSTGSTGSGDGSRGSILYNAATQFGILGG